MQPDMQLRIGSVTKQFTAVSILMLAEQGKLSVKDDFRKYLPDFPDKGSIVTIEHLLQHTSGIPNYTALKAFRELPDDGVTLAQVRDLFAREALEFAPGKRYSYSNSGYFLHLRQPGQGQTCRATRRRQAAHAAVRTARSAACWCASLALTRPRCASKKRPPASLMAGGPDVPAASAS